MQDDDIQYLGTVHAQIPQLASSPALPLGSNGRPVTGLVLHVQKSGDHPPYGMLFRRSNFSVVNIGRRPGTTIERRQEQTDVGRALFRCPVISRNHAKIAFSDTGVAYLIDLDSHHGTHILKPGETVSRMIKPETPTVLSTGDVITFGKTVGRDDSLVSPVVVRVELIYDSPSPTDLGSTTLAPFRKSPSGRYGVFERSSADSDASSSKSNNDSDIEEIEDPSKPSQCSPLGVPAPNLKRALSVLMSLMPPAHVPSSSQEQLNDNSHAPSRSLSPISPPWSPRSPSPFARQPSFTNDLPPVSSLPCFSPLESPRPFIPYEEMLWTNKTPREVSPVGYDAYSHDIFEDEYRPSPSRSTSPMDMSSPSPGPSERPEPTTSIRSGLFSRSSVVDEDEPSCEVDSPKDFGNSVLIEDEETPDTAEPADEADNADAVVDDKNEDADVSKKIVDGADGEVDDAGDDESTSEGRIHLFNHEIDNLKSSLVAVKEELTKLQLHRRKYKARFNANVHTMAEKLADLSKRVTNASTSHGDLSEQVENVTETDIPELQSQLDSLQNQIDAIAPRQVLEACEGEQGLKILTIDEFNASVAALNIFVDDMKALRESTEKQMMAELEAVKAARIEALAAIDAQAQQVRRVSDRIIDETTHNAQTLSLKRKRSIGDNDFDNLSGDLTSVSNLTTVDPPHNRKRLKRAASAIARTATAVTVGAVATWTALAFS